MPVFNEADVLPYALLHLRAQGVQVHALDGWSTDDSYEILRNFGEGVTVEQFPAHAPSPVQECRSILKRIEDLAANSGADWCMISDADEWRRSSRRGETLAEGIARVDKMGFNAIDFRVFAFYCTDNAWQGDPERHFRFFDEEDLICSIPNAKCWKNLKRVDLATHGGHLVEFQGKRTYPEKWSMKHYPYRTPAQAQHKLSVRLARRCHSEHADGWGVHYDAFNLASPMIWDPNNMRYWRDTESPLP